MVSDAGKKAANAGLATVLNSEHAAPPPPPPKGSGRGTASRARTGGRAKVKVEAQRSTPEHGANGPHGFYLPLNGSDPSHKRTRPLTQHQLAVEQYRRRRVEVILDRGLRTEHDEARKRRQGDSAFFRAWQRSRTLDPGYDSEEELATKAREPALDADHAAARAAEPAHVVGLTRLDRAEPAEPADFGEEAAAWAKAVNRALRRVDRWDAGQPPPATDGRSKKRRKLAPAAPAEPAPDADADATRPSASAAAAAADDDADLEPDDDDVDADDAARDLDHDMLDAPDEDDETDEDDFAAAAAAAAAAPAPPLARSGRRQR